MRPWSYLLPFLLVSCSATPDDTAPELQSVYDPEGNLKQNLSSTRSWEEQQELMKDTKDSLQKRPPVDAMGPDRELPKKK